MWHKRLSQKIGYPNRKLYKRHKDTKNNYTLEIGGNTQVKDICQKIYHNSTVRLERKHIRYKKLIKPN
jgi:hypothetical protein